MIPEFVRVGAHDIAVVQDPMGDLRSETRVGFSNPVENRITLPEEAPASRKLEILFHEMVHFVLSGHAAAFPNGFPEETIAVLLGEALVQMVRDNPGLFKYALRVLKERSKK